MAVIKGQEEEIFEYICLEIEKGRPLRKVLKDENTPANETFYKWLDSDKEKLKRYARACEERAGDIFDEILTIADNQEGDVLIGEDGTEYTNHNVINRSKLRIDARKWVLSKMQPNKYGDKLDLNLGGQKDNPVQITGVEIIKD